MRKIQTLPSLNFEKICTIDFLTRFCCGLFLAHNVLPLLSIPSFSLQAIPRRYPSAFLNQAFSRRGEAARKRKPYEEHLTHILLLSSILVWLLETCQLRRHGRLFLFC